MIGVYSLSAVPIVSLSFENSLKDSSGNNHNGSPTGNVKYTAGYIGKGVSLADAFIELQNTQEIQFDKDFTLTFWMNPKDNLPSTILSKPADTYVLPAFSFGTLEKLAGLRAFFSFIPNQNDNNYSTATNNKVLSTYVKPGNWYYVTIIFSKPKINMYLNGTLYDEYTIPPKYLTREYSFAKSNQNIIIGKDVTKKFSGLIDELKIYDYALSSMETKTMYCLDEFKKFNTTLTPEKKSLIYNWDGFKIFETTFTKAEKSKLLELKQQNISSGTMKMSINSPFMNVNGAKVEIDKGRNTAPVIVNSRTLVPIRAIAETIGAQINWDTVEERIDVFYNSNTLQLWKNSKKAKFNFTEEKEMDVPVTIVNERAMFPIRFIAESFSIKVDWLPNEKQIIITYPIGGY